MRRQASRHAAARPLRFEGLEPRRALATFTVTNLLDDGPGSLRDTIDQANAAEGADEIDFAVTGVIPLESQLPTITDSVSINGPGRDLLTLDAGGGASLDFHGDGYRLLELSHPIDVRIAGVTLTGGDHPVGGGAILSRANTLHLVGARIFENIGVQAGGGIASLEGTLYIKDSEVSSNTSYDEAGGIYNRATVLIEDSQITDNRASGDGGGILNVDGELSINSTLVAGNTAGADAGARFGGYGGGVASATGSSLVVMASTFRENTALRAGGALASVGDAIIRDSSFYMNMAEDGGAVSFGGAPIDALRVSSSTLSSNVASGNGGAIVLGGFSELVLNNVTITENHATNGGGVARGFNSNPTVVAKSSVVSGNIASTDVDIHALPVLGSFKFIGGDAMLSPLAGNGGPTLTHAPLPGSPLVDAGDPAFDVNGPDGLPGTDDDVPFDQRGDGFARVAGGRIDIGAVEVQFAAQLPGDANDDGVIDLLDVDILGQSTSFDLRADFNGDGVVDLLDLDILGQNWGRRALLLLGDDEPIESEDAPTIAARDEALADEAAAETPSPVGGGSGWG